MGILSSGDSGHQGTESPLHDILVGIPASVDSVQWGFRVHTPRNHCDKSESREFSLLMTKSSKKLELFKVPVLRVITG